MPRKRSREGNECGRIKNRKKEIKERERSCRRKSVGPVLQPPHFDVNSVRKQRQRASFSYGNERGTWRREKLDSVFCGGIANKYVGGAMFRTGYTYRLKDRVEMKQSRAWWERQLR